MAPNHRVAVIQWNIKDLAIDENHQKACAYICDAASQGAQLAVLPEYHLTGWSPSNPEWIALASQTTPYLTAYQALARDLHICIVPGTIVEHHPSSPTAKDDGPLLYNTAYFISNDGTILGHYRKKNIWHPERPFLTSSGTDPHEAFDTPIGKVGLLICWDLAFPEAFRELICKGAEVVIVPTYWSKYDASPAALHHNPNSEKLFLETTLTARCFENTCAIIFANVARGEEESDRFLGLSRVCLPVIGTVGAMGPEEGVLVMDMNMDVVRIAEENYRVREDLNREGWYYTYRHQSV
ncbi:hydrolase, carbon-nitrogen family [Aspergillus sclerotioniger CBS 115572]|uniref:Hydrolase, carbon-nitrogen family n=1 Tax=Aspergillus sclerotioniger CBS 115572 TaxID=1450535 RepID=A0A317W5F4_9EURO|nr:hydrolase, carbon-nitrogen family [Aspergillus sclerotioniger CBS 115572]PWY80457.1 hydrolase, carbon-nitrogen family [Aspergillus sclerotioniger CBS 115572]